jgi:hypothetical protein
MQRCPRPRILLGHVALLLGSDVHDGGVSASWLVDDLDSPVSKSTIKNEQRRRLTMTPLELGQDSDSAYFLIRSAPDL